MTERAAEPPRLSWEPLDLSRIEGKPKSVIADQQFASKIDLNERQQRDYAEIVRLIGVGGDLAPYYRRSTRFDALLKHRRVLHLHLGGGGSDALLYLVQYPAHVLLIMIDTHVHLDDVPVGKKLPLLGMRRFEAELRAGETVMAGAGSHVPDSSLRTRRRKPP